MRLTLLLGLGLVMGVACASRNGTEKPSRAPTNFQLLRNDWSDAPFYGSHGAAMVSICCPRRLELTDKDPPEGEAACRELERVIEAPRPGGAFENWGPRCFERIQTSSLLVALRQNRSIPDGLDQVLAETEPDDELASALLAELMKRAPGSELGNDAQTLRRPLEALPDHELEVIASHLESQDPIEIWAASLVLQGATAHPLVVPGLVDRLELHRSHPSAAISYQSRSAVEEYESRQRAEPDEHLLRAFSLRVSTASIVDERASAIAGLKVREQWKSSLRRVVSRRLAFCSSRLATMLLAALRADSDPTDSYLAERAIVLREKRCGARLRREPHADDLPREAS